MKKHNSISKILVVALVIAMIATMFGGLAGGGKIGNNSYVYASSLGGPSFKQCDTRWGANLLGTCSDTICSAGCAVTSVAMILKYYGVATDPGDLSNWLRNNSGYASGCLIVWDRADDRSGGSVQWAGKYTTSPGDWGTYTTNLPAQVKWEIDHGYPCVGGLDGHFVVITGYSDSSYYINDPYYARSTISQSSITKIYTYHGIPTTGACPKPAIGTSDNKAGILVGETDWVKFTVRNDGTQPTYSWGIQVKVGNGLELVQHPSYPWSQKVCNDKAAEWYKTIVLSPGTSADIWVGIKGETVSNYESVWYTAWMYDPDGQPQSVQYSHPIRSVPCDRDYAQYGVKVSQANLAPVLSNGYVDPPSGGASTDFYWYVAYFDPDGDSPSVRQVTIDGTAYAMSLYSGSASNGVYRYGPKNFSAGGTHYYFFYFEDGKGGTVRLPSGIDMYLGPRYAGQVIVFPDPNLEAAIREAINKPTGDIYQSDLQSRTGLVLQNKGISDLTGLQYCPSLTTLNLAGNQISDISLLADLADLLQLNLEGNPITDISPLAGLSKLQGLWLGANPITDISPIAGLTTLQYLTVGTTQITNIPRLSGLTSLQYLDLSYNQISDISSLAELTSLWWVRLMGNQIGDILALAGLTNLQILALNQNQIGDIAALAGLTKLEWLGLDENRIGDVTPLAGLVNLEVLTLDLNQITDVSPLIGLINLEKLYLNGNEITDVSPLAANIGLSAGDIVYLYLNPLNVDSFNTYIPQVKARGVTVYHDTQSTYIPSTVKVLMNDGSVETMNLDEYVKGVVAAEMGSAWPMEALKAQAVAARTFAVRNTQHEHVNIDVCTKLEPYVHCQAWTPPPYNAAIESAVASTHNQIITFNSKVIPQALYFSHCNGNTRNSEDYDSWNYFAYLRSVSCDCGYTSYYGHGVGMCQYGAKAMAQANYNYVDILKHYYTGVEIKTASSVSTYSMIHLGSPGELRVYDSRGRVTGLVDGQIQNQIPNSEYFDDTVAVWLSSDSYRYEVIGTDTGNYSVGITSVEDGEATTFNATDIPIAPGVVHQYAINWGALSEGQEAVIAHVDSDGDGIFEHTMTSSGEFTHDEFLLQTESTIDFDPDTLYLKSKDKYVTTYIELPLGYDVSQIDISSIRLDDIVPALAKPTQIGDYDSDGILDLMVKLDASAVKSLLTPSSQVEITITGEVAGIAFEGNDIIRVISR